MKYIFILISILGLSGSSIIQKDYKQLNIELIRQIKVNQLVGQLPIHKKISDFNKMSDTLLKNFFIKNAKKFLFEIRYGHKPKYTQYQSLKENVDSKSIGLAVESINNIADFNEIIKDFEPKNPDYHYLKTAMLSDTLQKLTENLNFYRYLNRFSLKKYLVLNIPSANLILYENHKNILEMNVIVGRFKNQTPRLVTYMDALIIYPYWIPTQAIATKELLPLIKRNIKYLYNNNFDVLDSRGNIVNPYSINWYSLSRSYFPYKLRQGTGCDNSLGLLKFNIVSPYTVYMHDTKHSESSTSLFYKKSRFFSHGCMRLSKPTELANLLTDSKLFDDEFMETCRLEQKTSKIDLKEKIPVFTIYQTYELDKNGQLKYYGNPYKLKPAIIF